MEILNILYSNNLMAVYLIGAILVIILIIIVLTSINTTPKNKENILKDPIKDKEEDFALQSNITEDNDKELNVASPILKEEPNYIDLAPIQEVKDNRINDMVEDLYQKTIEEEIKNSDLEEKDLNAFLQEFEVPSNVIEEVVKEDTNEEQNIVIEEPIKEVLPDEEIETPKLKESVEIKENKEPKENVEDMLKRLYDLRQNEKEERKKAILTEIIDLKKQLDETLKSNDNNYELEHSNMYNKELADYYLFNKDIEFPKLK